jgi:hypothetical protein
MGIEAVAQAQPAVVVVEPEVLFDGREPVELTGRQVLLGLHLGRGPAVAGRVLAKREEGVPGPVRSLHQHREPRQERLGGPTATGQSRDREPDAGPEAPGVVPDRQPGVRGDHRALTLDLDPPLHGAELVVPLAVVRDPVTVGAPVRPGDLQRRLVLADGGSNLRDP